ncbi:flagellar hook-associated protein FlgK [Romboutsia weinsteinii]|uniref:Flagellar hook-associated protein 1 n=1 Tax=Romboutsia weinsteinii TaxID=2020949 RepID=A0A255IP44_9FIRM|nr:flagellar hook-associated protein FlgK [Romboutsia weinsteinii]RDY28913.1 flagellar hook-associated protein FlgK [Romboutsia weinsteinii]
MAGLLGTLHSAASGMNASQKSIQTTSHNINNMNTPGYSRQRTEQSASRPLSQPGLNSNLGAGQLGTGVEITDIKRVRNTFYDFQFRSESHSYGNIGIKYDYYNNMESIFNEPSETSISTSLNNFFNSMHELSKDPESLGAKNIVIENSKYLANTINQVYKKIDNLSNSLDKQTDGILDDINSMLSSLKELDKNIKIVESTGKTPNDLLDQRDRILDELSFKINIHDKDVQTAISDGSLTKDELGILNVSGELAGCMEMKRELENYTESLKSLSKGIVDGVNDIYGGEFFKYGDSDPVISVNEDILNNPSNLTITSDKALELYNLKSKKINIDGEDISINNYYNSIVQKLGHSTQEIKRNEKNQSELMKSIDGSRLSVSGVSMDEEMVNLVQLQHAYNASAKVISTIDSLLDVVVNGLVK